MWLAKANACLKELALPQLEEGLEHITSISAAAWGEKVRECVSALFVSFFEKQTETEEYAITRAMLPEIVCRQPRKRGDPRDPPRLEYMFRCTPEERSLLLHLAGACLPLQACRKSCKSLRPGGAEADEVCKLCNKADEDLHHFLFDCDALRGIRATHSAASPLRRTWQIN